MRSFWGLMKAYWISDRWKEAWTLTIVIALLTALSSKASVWFAMASGELVNSIAFLHDAANTRPDYWDKFAPQGIFIGTDKSEVWTRDQFKAWAKRFWDRKKAWNFTAQKRNVHFSPDKQYVWFDEQLNTQMGTCQASGVLRNTPDGFKIEHYQLSLAVPNPLMDSFSKAIAEHEKKAAP